MLTPGEPAGAYALSALWVLAVLALAAYLLRGLAPLARAGVLCAVVALPILNTVIGVFRPDISWGLVTGATATILATTDLLGSSRRTLFFIGALVGVSMLSKPNGMPAGVTVMGTAYLAAVIVTYLEHRSANWRAVLKASLLMALAAAIVALPYYAFSGRQVVKTIWTVMVDQFDIWREPGSLSAHLKYYFQPYLAKSMLGWLWTAGAALVLAHGALCAIRWNSERTTALRFLATLPMLVVAYAIPSFSPVKHAFIGCLFYGTLAMVLIWNLGCLVQRLRIPASAIAVLGLLLFVAFWRPSNINTVLHPSMPAADAAHRAIMPAVLEALPRRGAAGPAPTVLVASVGPIFDATLRYYSLKQGLGGQFTAGATATTWEDALQRASSAHIVIVSETGALGQSGTPFPGSRFQDRLMQTLAADTRFRTLASFTDPTGHRTIAFARQPE